MLYFFISLTGIPVFVNFLLSRGSVSVTAERYHCFHLCGAGQWGLGVQVDVEVQVLPLSPFAIEAVQ